MPAAPGNAGRAQRRVAASTLARQTQLLPRLPAASRQPRPCPGPPPSAATPSPAQPPTRADGAQKVGDNGEGADAHAAKGGSGGDVPVQLLLQAAHGVAVALRGRAAGGARGRKRGCGMGREGQGWQGGRQRRRLGQVGREGRPGQVGREGRQGQVGQEGRPRKVGREGRVVVGHPQGARGLTARKNCWSRSCLATSLALCPDTSIQVMEKMAQTGARGGGGRRGRDGLVEGLVRRLVGDASRGRCRAVVCGGKARGDHSAGRQGWAVRAPGEVALQLAWSPSSWPAPLQPPPLTAQHGCQAPLQPPHSLPSMKAT